jgi:hypothetical protein
MKCFNSTKPKYNHLFKTTTIITNFLHRHCLDFTFEVIDNHITDLIGNYGWDRDF